MALIIKTDNTTEVVHPKHSLYFSVDELQKGVGGGYFEVVRLSSRLYLMVDERGVAKKLPDNQIASELAFEPIVGQAMLCTSREFC